MLSSNGRSANVQSQVALALRVGLGLVFISGGVAKLERLLTQSKAQGIVDQYVGSLGYINQTFLDWLFASPLGAVLTPWNFLTTLSAFELISGIMLVVGLMVRPLSLLWAFLLWSFVVSLPVVTTPGINLGGKKTYMSPAELIQIRDIALSGFFFVLYNLGSGLRSVDSRFGLPETCGREWDPLGLLMRLALGVAFLIGGLFAGYDNIVTWGIPGIVLAIVGAGLIAGVGTRYFALAAGACMLWFLAAKLPAATGIIGYFNSVKREFALLAGAGALAVADGGKLYVLDQAVPVFRRWLAVYIGKKKAEPAPNRAT